VWVRDGSLSVPTHALRQLAVIDIGILDGGADSSPFDPSIVPVCHALEMHHLLMVGTVIVHHAQQTDTVMSCGPEHARRVHEISVILDIHRQTPILLVCEGCSNSRWSAISHTCSAGAANVLVILVDIPETCRPVALC